MNFFRDYFLLLSEAKYDAKYVKGLEKSTPKQMIQKLPIALGQVKACNASENLLNKIRKIIYPLH